jgi:hypothetical protein
MTSRGQSAQPLWKMYSAAAAAAIAAYEAAQWRPIEEAPTDGSWVLLWCGWTIEGRWSEDGKRVKRGWSEDGEGINPIFMVTHFRPLLPCPPGNEACAVDVDAPPPPATEDRKP